MPLVAADDLQGEFEGNGCACTPAGEPCVEINIRPACGGGLCTEWMGCPLYHFNCGSFYCGPCPTPQAQPYITPDKDHYNLACCCGAGFKRKGVANTGAPIAPEMER